MCVCVCVCVRVLSRCVRTCVPRGTCRCLEPQPADCGDSKRCPSPLDIMAALANPYLACREARSWNVAQRQNCNCKTEGWKQSCGALDPSHPGSQSGSDLLPLGVKRGLNPLWIPARVRVETPWIPRWVRVGRERS